MKPLHTLLGLLILLSFCFSVPGHAAPATGLPPEKALDIAKAGIDPSLQGKLVSVYGTGTTTGIDNWWFIYYDPSVDTHGRAVKVVNGQVAKSYPAAGGVVYADSLNFAPDQVRGLGKALSAAEDYSARHSIRYNQVRVLLRLTTAGEPLRWRVQLMDRDRSRGFVFVDAETGAFAMYRASAAHHATTSTGGDSVEAHAEAAGDDVKDTFMGIGGDLQQFFTGERTVDR